MSLDPKVYRKAFEILDREIFCCNAIEKIIGWPVFRPNEVLAFQEYFEPEVKDPEHVFAWYGDIDDPDNKIARSLALLFMEQIAKDMQ